MTEQGIDLQQRAKAREQGILEALAAQGITAIPFGEIDSKYVKAAQTERQTTLQIIEAIGESVLVPLSQRKSYDFALYGRTGETDAVLVGYQPQLCGVTPEIQIRTIRKVKDVVDVDPGNPKESLRQIIEIIDRAKRYMIDRDAPQRLWLDNPSRFNTEYLSDIVLKVERAFPVEAYQEIARFFGFELVPEAIAYQYAKPITRAISGPPPTGVPAGSLIGRTEVVGHYPPQWVVEVHYVVKGMAGKIEHVRKHEHLPCILRLQP